MMTNVRIGSRGHRRALYLLVMLICPAATVAVADEKLATTGKSPLGRYLLVASEGLYVVEPDGSCSWSHHPEPYQGQGWVEYDDLVYDGWAFITGQGVVDKTSLLPAAARPQGQPPGRAEGRR